MLEQELKEIWKNSSQEEKIKFDLSRLLIDLNAKMSRIVRSIRNRNKADIIAAMLTIPIFGYFAYEIPFVVTKVGIIFTMILLGYLFFKFRDAKKHKLSIDPALSFREQLANQKSYLLKEANLKDTVLFWFLLPTFVAHSILVLGLGDPVEYGWTNIIANEILPIPLTNKIAYLFFVAILFAGILWMNKREVKKTLKPLIEDIERVQHQLESED